MTVNQQAASQHDSRRPGYPRANPRDSFILATIAYIGYNVLASIIGVIAKLPDVTTTHQKTTNVTLGQFLSDGTIVSPPLFLMIPIALLLWATTGRRRLVRRICTLLVMIGAGLTVLAELTGLSPRPSIFTAAKWDLVIAVGIVFAVFGVAVIATGLVRLYRSFAAGKAS
jgi:uncharacterized membrane protein